MPERFSCRVPGRFFGDFEVAFWAALVYFSLLKAKVMKTLFFWVLTEATPMM
jgi:hypothetical protein